MISPVQPKDIDKKKKKAPAAAAAEGHDEKRRREEKGDGERWIWVYRYHRGRPGFDLQTADRGNKGGLWTYVVHRSYGPRRLGPDHFTVCSWRSPRVPEAGERKGFWQGARGREGPWHDYRRAVLSVVQSVEEDHGPGGRWRWGCGRRSRHGEEGHDEVGVAIVFEEEEDAEGYQVREDRSGDEDDGDNDDAHGTDADTPVDDSLLIGGETVTAKISLRSSSTIRFTTSSRFSSKIVTLCAHVLWCRRTG